MPALLEHANFTVSDPTATAAWMENLFGWKIRWQGDAIDGGHTVHVGTDDRYVALFTPKTGLRAGPSGYVTVGGLNHIAVVVDDLDRVEREATAHGFVCGNHQDYEPGRRFYFHDTDGIEYEVVHYG